MCDIQEGMVCRPSCVTYRKAWSVGLHVCDIQEGLVCRPSCVTYRKEWSVGLDVRHTRRHGL